MVKKVIFQVRFEIGQIDRLFDSYDDLLKQTQKNVPDMVEVTALASVLHSFYNGMENIFLSIAKGIDQQIPTGDQWNRDLLAQMTKATSNRASVLTVDMAHQLANYLGFRHFFRHSYSFFLDWEELENLVKSFNHVWEQTRNELYIFLESMNIEKSG